MVLPQDPFPILAGNQLYDLSVLGCDTWIDKCARHPKIQNGGIDIPRSIINGTVSVIIHSHAGEFRQKLM